VSTDWYNSSQVGKGVEEGEWYGEEGIDDRELVLTGWVVNARTILVKIDLKIFNCIIALIPYKSIKAACTMETMWCDWCATKYLKYW
jgi:hypothetical protein